MARIPLTIAQRSLDPGSPVSYAGVSDSPTGRALQGLGGTIQGVAERWQAQVEQAQTFEATQKFNQLKLGAQSEIPQIQQGVDASGLGLHDKVLESFDQRANDFLTKLPPQLQQKFGALTETARMQFSNAAAELELNQRQSWYRTGIAESLQTWQNAVFENPGQFDAAWDEFERHVDAAGLDAAEKQEWKTKAREALTLSLAEREIRDAEAQVVNAGVAATRLGIRPEAAFSAGVSSAINQAAERHGVDAGALAVIAQLESSGNPNAQNPRSSAGGLFQFIDSTARQYGLTNKFDANQSADAGARLMKDNAAGLRRALGREPTVGELYLAHQQGLGGATKLLTNPNELAVGIVGYDAVRLNGGAPGETAAQFASRWINKANKIAGAPMQATAPSQGGLPSAAEAFESMDPRYRELPLEKRLRIYDRMLASSLKGIQQRDAQQAAYAKLYVGEAEDYAAWLRAGNAPTDRFTREEIIASLGPEKALPVIEEIDRAAEFGSKVAAVKWATPGEVAMMVATEEARLADPTDYQANAKEATALMQAVQHRNTALQNDPVGYVLQNDAIRGAYDQMAQAQQSGQGVREASLQYAAAVTAAQERLGVENPRILTPGLAHSIAREFSDQDEGGQNAAQIMQTVASQWGDQWPQVFAELSEDLPGSVLVIGAMDRPDQMRAAEQLAEASKLGKKAIEDTLSNEAVRGVRESVLAELQEFRGTLVNNVGGERTFGTFHEGIYTLALSYVSQGDDPTTAAERAYNDVIGKRYAIEDTYRVPVEHDRYDVRDGATRFLENLAAQELDLPVSLMGLPDEDTRAAYVSSLEENAFWVTAPDESGLMLMRPDRHAVTANGRPLIVKWGELTARGSDAPVIQGRPDVGGLGMPVPTGTGAFPDVDVPLPEIEVTP